MDSQSTVIRSTGAPAYRSAMMLSSRSSMPASTRLIVQPGFSFSKASIRARVTVTCSSSVSPERKVMLPDSCAFSAEADRLRHDNARVRVNRIPSSFFMGNLL